MPPLPARSRPRRPAWGRALLAACALGVAASPAGAQAVRSASLTLDNDILALRGAGAPPDHDYTHGLSVAVELRRPPRWLAGDSALRARVGAGQRIYTPRRDAPEPVPGERPYAAWLFVSGQVARESGRRRRSAEVEVGVVGPAALGEPVQNGVHRLLGSAPQEGWAHGLRTEPGILVRIREGWRVDRSVAGLGTVRVTPGGFATLGNVRTSAGVETAVEVERGHGEGPFARVEARGEWVARDLFLDGNTFRRNSLAERRPSVAEVETAAGFRWRRWAAEYRFVVRSREYRAQPEGHRYGSLRVTRRW